MREKRLVGNPYCILFPSSYASLNPIVSYNACTERKISKVRASAWQKFRARIKELGFYWLAVNEPPARAFVAERGY